jgi:hypothetical protein
MPPVPNLNAVRLVVSQMKRADGQARPSYYAGRIRMYVRAMKQYAVPGSQMAGTLHDRSHLSMPRHTLRAQFDETEPSVHRVAFLYSSREEQN